VSELGRSVEADEARDEAQSIRVRID